MASRKRGRPSLGHTAELSIPVTPALSAEVSAAAKAAGLSVAEYVRRAVTAAMVKP